jgi:XTP/dITP diphosphohydrolase
MKLFFASHNLDKKKEIEYIVSSEKILVLYIDDFPKYPEVEETGLTLEENAILKAEKGFEFTGLDTFAEDTGLFVDYLSGAPGILTARYAGEKAAYSDNCRLLLENMKTAPKEKRKAYFKTVVAFKQKNGTELFTGICEGKISEKQAGNNGFGYDPIFIPNCYEVTFAQLDKEIKNKISHRAKAVDKFSDYLKRKFGA